jgi:nucleoside-diphosphate-sugar epimerase
MQIAVTGATGFIGRYIVNQLTGEGHACRCWARPDSDRGGFNDADRIEWIEGELGDDASAVKLTRETDAVVHAALFRPGRFFRGGEGELVTFVERNVVGTLKLIRAARDAGVQRFVYLSTCAVHDRILDDRPLDEAHPLWASNHYGAHKAAVEQFIHSLGFGEGYNICALRPTGVYGLTRPIENSKWFDLIRQVAAGEPIESDRGGKEVHAADVAKAVSILLTAEGIAGQAYNCFDMYVAEQDVAEIAKAMTGSDSTIARPNRGPKHQIVTDKLRSLGMNFGGETMLKQTIREIIDGA